MPGWRLTRFEPTALAGLAGLLLGSGLAVAQVDQGRALASVEAAREIARAVAASPTPDEAPRLDNPRYSELFDRALDAGVSGSDPADATGLGLLHDMQRAAGSILRAYLLAGVPSPGQNALRDEAAGDQAARNFVAFQPEVGELYDFRVRIGGNIAEGCVHLAATASSDVPTALAVAAVAEEQERILLSAISVAGDNDIDPQWRKQRLAVLSESVGDYAVLFGRKKAQEIADRALASAMVEQDPAVALALKDFALALLR